MTITNVFDSNPHGLNTTAGSTVSVRLWDKSTTTSGVIDSWSWYIEIPQTWTVSAPPSTHLNFANANLYFAVGDAVILWTSSGSLPTGLSAWPTVYYIVTAAAGYVEIATAPGGAAVQYTSSGTGGTYTINPASTSQNPIITLRNVSAGSYRALLYVTDSSGAGQSGARDGLVIINTTAYAKPTNAGLFGRITIFIYDSTNATAINRVKTTNNNLFFQSLRCNASITKAGAATFTVYNVGSATATEIGLMVADKNVAIISGRDVIWSGKISRATQGALGLYDSASPFQSWDIECESDISKMRYQNVKAANQIAYNAPPGYIINKLVEPSAATDIDWRGAVTPSLISYEGANIQYTITSADMYSQFLTLADLTGFDWRTRNDWVKYAYGASGYDSSAKTVTVAAITPYTTNSFAGKWLLFINSSGTIGIQAYGQVTSNTTTVLTMTTITNSGTPPASSDYVIILGNPVLDFSSDFRQPSYVSTFTMNKARAATLQNGYEMNDMSDFKQVITKIIAKGKGLFPQWVNPSFVPANTTQTITFAAKDAWDNAKDYFENSTWVTQKTEGYIYSFTANATTVVLIGQDYALANGDDVLFFAIRTTGATAFTGGTLNATPTTQIQADGTQTTTISLAATPDATYSWIRGSVVVGEKTYMKDNTVVDIAGGLTNVGTTIGRQYTSIATDAVWGPYGIFNGMSAGTIVPALPGSIISKVTYTEAAPQTGSPLNYFGVITKTLTADQTVPASNLAIYAINYLINHSFYYRKGSFWAFVYDWFKPDLRAASEVSENGWLRAGDEICILQNTADSPTDLQYGQYKNQWQVVAWELDADSMTVKAQLGDHERNTNTLINDKTAGINYTIT